MKNHLRFASALLLAAAVSGCAAMSEGMTKMNQMAEAAAQRQSAQQTEALKSDIAKGRFSGKVRVLMVTVIPPSKGFNREKLIAMIRSNYAGNAQFEILDDASATAAMSDLGQDFNTASLIPSLINTKAKRLERTRGLRADVILRAGFRFDPYTGINQSTGKVAQSMKAVSWAEYVAIGTEKVMKEEFEDANFFKVEVPIKKSAAAFHETVLSNLMIERQKARLAESQAATK